MPVDEVGFGRNQGFVAPTESITFAEVARASPGWRAQAEFDPASFAFSNGAHLCEGEVKRDTGTVRILRYTAVDDVGNVINPLIVESQPYTLNPLGANGAGEAGTIAAPAALVSAVLDALRDNGVNDLEMPLPPARVWAALPRRARA